MPNLPFLNHIIKQCDLFIICWMQSLYYSLSYLSFFSSWSFVIPTNVHRPLEYLCEHFTTCSFKVIYRKVSGEEGQLKQWQVSAVFNYMVDPIPILSGTIKLCIIKDGSFKMGFSRARCIYWRPFLYIAPTRKGMDLWKGGLWIFFHYACQMKVQYLVCVIVLSILSCTF